MIEFMRLDDVIGMIKYYYFVIIKEFLRFHKFDDVIFRYTFCAYGKTLTSHKPVALGLTGTC